MPPKLDLIGQRFGRWLVLEEHSKNSRGAYLWMCVCDCGTRRAVWGSQLKTGVSRSCGCGVRDAHPTTHGMTGTPLYGRWRAMLGRVGDPNHSDYHNYGGRGISIYEPWMSFENFAADMGPTFSEELTIDRIDVNGDYAPENCRWATVRQQNRNKRTNHVITWHGRSMPVQDWAELLGLKPNTVIYRLRRGWSIDRALSKGVPTDVLLSVANPSVATTGEDRHL